MLKSWLLLWVRSACASLIGVILGKEGGARESHVKQLLLGPQFIPSAYQAKFSKSGFLIIPRNLVCDVSPLLSALLRMSSADFNKTLLLTLRCVVLCLGDS